MINDIELVKVTEELCTGDIGVTQLKNEMKKLPLAKKMAKAVKMKRLQHQVMVLHKQHQQRTDKVIGLQVEVGMAT